VTQTGVTPGPPPSPVARSGATDPTLIARARAGDLEAFERVAAGKVDALWRLARAILPSDEGAHEAVQSTLVAAWRELPRLDDLARFDDWLDRILLSECRMRLGSSRPEVAPAAPASLLASTMAAARAAPPRTLPPRDTAWPATRLPAAALALAAVLAVVLVVAVGVPWLRERVATPGSPAPAGGEVTAGAATPGPTGPASSARPTGSPPAAAADELGIDVIAMVTLDGDNLRVRSAPGVGDDSRRLRPLLPAGTRMLVVGGPVEADGYTWWEVRTDGVLVDLFGWVADGDEQGPWVVPTAPRCWSGLDAGAVTSLSRIDFLACYGDARVRLDVDAGELWNDPPPPDACGWVRAGGGCDADAEWLLLGTGEVEVRLAGGDVRPLGVAVPPDIAEAVRTLPLQRSLALTVSLDAPEAAGCRIRDAASGRALMPDDQAVTACRLQFVVQEVVIGQ
jgi:DNA-directed RNA polymerase specialized sigma24 family protein